MLRDGRADVLVVAAFDRSSRTRLGAVADLVEVLDAREEAGAPAEFIAIRDGISSRAAGWRITAATPRSPPSSTAPTSTARASTP